MSKNEELTKLLKTRKLQLLKKYCISGEASNSINCFVVNALQRAVMRPSTNGSLCQISLS